MRKPTPISELQNYATQQHGKLVSTKYENCNTPLEWECGNNHIWKARWDKVKNGGWCPICRGVSKYSIETLQQFAKDKHGSLISTEYKNKKTDLLWECLKGHQWNATWNNIKSGRWCPYCGNGVPDIKTLQDFAENKSGKLVSSFYEHSQNPLVWECLKGHQWNASWNNIRAGGWCPICKQFKTEMECKTIVELLLKASFIKHRIYYDKINKLKFFEIDIFNKKLNIGFEYNGEQHYIYPNRFHKIKTEFDDLQLRDKEKLEYCKNNGITLYIIPYTQKSNLEQYIKCLLNYD